MLLGGVVMSTGQLSSCCSLHYRSYKQMFPHQPLSLYLEFIKDKKKACHVTKNQQSENPESSVSRRLSHGGKHPPYKMLAHSMNPEMYR